MALINCSECGKEVSNKAVSCPNCGNPIRIDKIIKIQFPKISNQIFNTGCEILDNESNILAKCKQGEIAQFESDTPLNIIVKMKGCLNTTNILAEPGCRYKVNVRSFGTIGISKVDIL